MKLIVLFLSITTVSFCSAAEKLPAGHPPVNEHSHILPSAPAQLPQTGKVTDVINVAQYTYLEVTQDQQTHWLAGPTVEVKKGDTVHFDDGMEMKDFHSNSLDRTFPSVFFVNSIVVAK